MRRYAFALVVLVGCFNPRSNGATPDGGAGDASQDGTVTSTDRDGDGLDNDKDNCPDNANTDQANEDGDATGDACDLCPQLASASTADTDGDKIGDACDPNPAVKENVWLFEGFHKGLPNWTKLTPTNWKVSTDSITVTAPGGQATDDEWISPPLTATGRTYDNFTLTAVMSPKTFVGGSDHAFGVGFYDANDNILAPGCGLGQEGTQANMAELGLYDGKDMQSSATFAWVLNATYTISMKRVGTQYTCTVVSSTGQTQSVTGVSPAVPRKGADFDVWAFGASVQVNSVFVTGP